MFHMAQDLKVLQVMDARRRRFVTAYVAPLPPRSFLTLRVLTRVPLAGRYPLSFPSWRGVGSGRGLPATGPHTLLVHAQAWPWSLIMGRPQPHSLGPCVRALSQAFPLGAPRERSGPGVRSSSPTCRYARGGRVRAHLKARPVD